MDKDLIEIWKKSRESIEHFDKLLAEFRRMIFTIEGVALTVGVALLLSTNPRKIPYVGYLSLGVSIINIIVWAVEKHYHLYLLMSAKVAENIEEKLDLDDKLRLTTQLRKAREELQPAPCLCGIKFSLYDFIYIGPALITLALAFLAQLYFWATGFLLLEGIIVICLMNRHKIKK